MSGVAPPGTLQGIDASVGHDLRFTLDVVNQLVVPTFVLDATGRVVAWNAACERLTGMPAGSVLGTREHWRAFYGIERPCLADLIVNDRLDEIGDHYPVWHRSEGVDCGVHAENWCVMPLLGSRLFVEIDASPILDADGRLVAVVETLRDMTQRVTAENRLRAMFDRSPDPVWIIEGGRFVECNDAAVKLLRYENKQELLDTHPSQLSPPVQPDGEDSYTKAERMMQLAMEAGMHRFEWVHTRADATTFTAEVTLSLIELVGRQAIYCAWRDISDRKNAEEAVRLYARAFENSGEAILVTDRHKRIVTLNRAFTRLTGYTLAEVQGEYPTILTSPRTLPATFQAMWASLKASGYWQGELWDRRRDGSDYPCWGAVSAICNEGSGEPTYYVASFSDVSERKAAEARIDHLAHHDNLTGLYNRYSLESRLAQSLLEAKRERRSVAVIFIDLDRFKVINDTLGHHAGDQLLCDVGRRLVKCVRESDVVARLGGDEFIVVLTRLAGEKDAALVAANLLRTLGSPYELAGKVVHSTPSIGISLYPHDGADPETLLKHADAAMYHAKERGRNNFQFSNAAMMAVASERMELESDLRGALIARQYELHYQPQVCAVTERVVGVEALIRWRHPRRGLLFPVSFIPIAEETGAIEAIGHWVMDEACRQLAEWRTHGIDGLRMAINLSSRQLRSPDLVDRVRATLRQYGLGDGDLELEITESAAMADPARAIDQLKALRELGVSLAIDDFGTGYSSLAYLKLLPIQILKLDRGFVRDLETDENDAAISAATVALAHSLGLKVVAEGVETEGQSRFLRAHKCDVLQGYRYGRPAPASDWSECWKAEREPPESADPAPGPMIR